MNTETINLPEFTNDIIRKARLFIDLKSRIVEIIGQGMEQERAECKADEIMTEVYSLILNLTP